MIVGDSSALIALSIADCLGYLPEKFGGVFVPKAVFDELSLADKNQSEKLKSFLQDKIVEVSNKKFRTLWIGNGEAEAIDLYLELDADLLLIDDRRAGNFAKMNGIHTIGSLGVLLMAKQDGFIPKLKPVLDLLAASGIYISDTVVIEVLKRCNEI